MHWRSYRGALTTLGLKSGMFRGETMEARNLVNELPFDSDRKMINTYHTNIVADKIVSYTKGAPDIILSKCKFYHVLLRA